MSRELRITRKGAYIVRAAESYSAVPEPCFHPEHQVVVSEADRRLARALIGLARTGGAGGSQEIEGGYS